MTDPLRRTGPWVTSVGAALATIITLCTPTSPARAVTSVPPPPAAAATRAVVRTLDGHLMALGPEPGGLAVRLPVANPGEAGVSVRVHRTPEGTFVIPLRLAGLVGSPLDPRVFLVDGVGRGTARGVAVSITYTSSTAPSAVPGVEIVSRQGLTASGYVTTASRIALGRALATSDAASLFTHVAALRVSAAPLVQPLFPMVTLTLRGINAQGGPLDGGADAAYVQVVNVDDARRYSGFATFVRGQARVSVPVGHYHVDTVSVNRLKPTELRSVLQPEVVVSTAMTLTTDARTATVPVRISADVATVPELTGTAYGRYDATGAGAASGVLVVPPGVAALSAPTAPVTIGTLRVLALARLAAPTVVRNRYGFEVVRELGGVIPPSMTLTVRRAEMVTENDLYYSPIAGQGMSTRTTWLGDFAVSWGGWVQSQSRLTTYLMPDLRILGGYAPWVDQTSGAIGPVYYGAVQRAGAGALRTVPWAKAPVGPSLPTQDSGGGIVCPVCVSDDTLTFSTYPFGDTVPAHWSLPAGTSVDVESGSWQVTADSALIVAGDGAPHGYVALPTGTGMMGLTTTQTGRRGGSATPSTYTSTWDLPVAAAAPAPVAWRCLTGASGACAALPVILVDYGLPLRLDNSVAAGPQVATLRLWHLDRRVPVDLASVTLRLSYDGGGTWRDAAVTGVGGGAYRVTFTAPSAGGAPLDVAVDLSATERSGASVHQVTTAAFTVR
ncbi:MAG: hypothetical protein U0Q14_00810 [Dermatophilaceae bacterium]